MAKNATGKGESIQGYFRAIYQENPKLLGERSNDVLYERWLKDHPADKTVPDRVKQSLSNLKSVLRAKSKRRGRKRQEALDAAVPGAVRAPARKVTGLDRLEALVDDALQHARQLDPEGLTDIISLLRTARNRVIVKVEGE